jgi:hypothetical protein
MKPNIEIHVRSNPTTVVAKGLIPGQLLRLHLPDGQVWNVNRFGAECSACCEEQSPEKKGKAHE